MRGTVGRYDDMVLDGISQLADVITCIKNYDWSGKNPDGVVEIITASVRTANHVVQAALLGAEIATVPMKTLKKCPPSSARRCRHCGLRGRLGARRKRVRRGVGKVSRRFGGPVVVKRFIAGKHHCFGKNSFEFTVCEHPVHRLSRYDCRVHLCTAHPQGGIVHER